MDRLDVALVGVCSRRDAHVLTVAHLGGKAGRAALPVVASDELCPVVGLPDQIAQGDTVAFQVPLDACGEHGTGRGGAPLGKTPEQKTAANFSCGVLNP